MKKTRILVVSARNALRYVMRHFCEPGVTEYAEETDTYAAISIQDTYDGGFGFELKKNKYCKDVLTLYFDDNVRKRILWRRRSVYTATTSCRNIRLS